MPCTNAALPRIYLLKKSASACKQSRRRMSAPSLVSRACPKAPCSTPSSLTLPSDKQSRERSSGAPSSSEPHGTRLRWWRGCQKIVYHSFFHSVKTRCRRICDPGGMTKRTTSGRHRHDIGTTFGNLNNGKTRVSARVFAVLCACHQDDKTVIMPKIARSIEARKGRPPSVGRWRPAASSPAPRPRPKACRRPRVGERDHGTREAEPRSEPNGSVYRSVQGGLNRIGHSFVVPLSSLDRSTLGGFVAPLSYLDRPTTWPPSR